MELFATNFVEFEKSGVGSVKLVNGSSNLGWEADGVEKLVGKSGVNAVEAFTSVVRKTAVGSVEEAGSFNANVLS